MAAKGEIRGHATAFFWDDQLQLCKSEGPVSWTSTAGPGMVELHYPDRWNGGGAGEGCRAGHEREPAGLEMIKNNTP